MKKGIWKLPFLDVWPEGPQNKLLKKLRLIKLLNKFLILFNFYNSKYS